MNFASYGRGSPAGRLPIACVGTRARSRTAATALISRCAGMKALVTGAAGFIGPPAQILARRRLGSRDNRRRSRNCAAVRGGGARALGRRRDR